MKPASVRRAPLPIAGVALGALFLPGLAWSADTPLPSSKLLGASVPGNPQVVNSFPSAVAVSPDRTLVAFLANGFGTVGSGVNQSIVLVDVATGYLTDVPDPRLAYDAKQTAFGGIAFSRDGRSLFLSFASLSDPLGKGAKATGNGVAVFRVEHGTVTPDRFLSIPLRTLAAGQVLTGPLPGVAAGFAVPYPAGLAVIPREGGDHLLVAGHLSDELVEVDVASGAVVARIPLGTGAIVPSLYPIGVIASGNGKTAWVSLWNASAVAEVDLVAHQVRRTISLLPGERPTDAGSHPTAMILEKNQRRLFVTLANADAVAVVNTRTGKHRATWSTRLSEAMHGGSTPNALALSADERKLFVANAGANAIAVLGTHPIAWPWAHVGRRFGFLPTEWYPTALAMVDDQLFVATGKGRGTGPNSGPAPAGSRRAHPYIASILPGSIARISWADAARELGGLTEEVLRSNRIAAKPPEMKVKPPIRHAIYIIKENRTYDQVLGDLGVGNGDPSLTLYGADITPNEHALALRFGVLDNYYCSGEVSGDGHVWSTAATTSDYTERTWQIGYRSDEHTYDYEGKVLNGFPNEQGIPNIDEPGTGYLWAHAERHGVSHYNFGEFVTSVWCDEPVAINPGVLGTPLTGVSGCPRAFIQPGEALPDGVGQPPGSPSPWPWPVPVLSSNVATMPELKGNFDPRFADFRMDYPDQLRADRFVQALDEWSATKAKTGTDPMPQLIILRLPNDHTAGTRAGFPTPAATVADNDLALGRVVEAVSHSPYWEDTAIFVLEDDAQDGADHVDAHRSIAFAISKYSPSGVEAPLIDSTFYTTVSTIRTIEVLLGLPPMNNNDAWASIMEKEFSGPGNQPAYDADRRNLANGLIYAMNKRNAHGAMESATMDFRHADAVDTTLLNSILWADRKGDVPMPPIRRAEFMYDPSEMEEGEGERAE